MKRRVSLAALDADQDIEPYRIERCVELLLKRNTPGTIRVFPDGERYAAADISSAAWIRACLEVGIESVDVQVTRGHGPTLLDQVVAQLQQPDFPPQARRSAAALSRHMGISGETARQALASAKLPCPNPPQFVFHEKAFADMADRLSAIDLAITTPPPEKVGAARSAQRLASCLSDQGTVYLFFEPYQLDLLQAWRAALEQAGLRFFRQPAWQLYRPFVENKRLSPGYGLILGLSRQDLALSAIQFPVLRGRSAAASLVDDTKPVWLLRSLIRFHPTARTLLDPFMASDTILTAAQTTSITTVIGCQPDPRLVARLKQHAV
jgi:hypothetical protein